MIDKTCIIDSNIVDFDGCSNDNKVKILDVNSEWVKIEYERTKENTLFKKEKVVKYLELSSINGFQIEEEVN